MRTGACLSAGVNAGGAVEADPGGSHDAPLEQHGLQHALLRAKRPHEVFPWTHHSATSLLIHCSPFRVLERPIWQDAQNSRQEPVEAHQPQARC